MAVAIGEDTCIRLRFMVSIMFVEVALEVSSANTVVWLLVRAGKTNSDYLILSDLKSSDLRRTNGESIGRRRIDVLANVI